MSSEDRSAEDATGTESPARPLEGPRNAPEPGKLPNAVQAGKRAPKGSRPRTHGGKRDASGRVKGEDREEARDKAGIGKGAEAERRLEAMTAAESATARAASLSLARAREPAIAAWADLIAAGQTERSAAAQLEAQGIATYAWLADRCQRYPELDAVRAAGHEACAQRYLDEIERLGREGIPREHAATRQDARILATRIAALQWLLAVKDRRFRVSARQDDAPVQSGPAVTVVLADARSLARDVDGDPPAALPASPEAARRLRR